MTLDKLRPVARQSTETIVTENLRDYILSGDIEPGGRLTEIALADQLGVARSTLRMGLHRLAAEGIVVQTPYTGWHVASLSADDVWEIWTLRGSLESLASRLAAERTEAAARTALDAAFDGFYRACETGQIREMTEADFALHRAILDASGHRRLADQYRLVEQQVRLFIATSNRFVATGPEDLIAQHEPLIGAIRARDGEAAARAAWDHDATEGARLMNWLETRAEVG